ncbi:hypothetical protein [Nocardia carnea]|uniref:hypothetical protein n=1 Tax=Nocardia carnea TaxID=37328 RepID=UPI0003190AE0|nr:hypothetical protein [Nocardia carnea]
MRAGFRQHSTAETCDSGGCLNDEHNAGPDGQGRAEVTINLTRPLRILLFAGLLYTMVSEVVQVIVWPSVWLERDLVVDGMPVEKVQVSMSGAGWLERVACAGPMVLLVALAAFPVFAVVRRIAREGITGDNIFAAALNTRIRASFRWCCLALLVYFAASFVSDWLLGQHLGGDVSQPPSGIAVVLLVGGGAACTFLDAAKYGRGLRSELDTIL